MSESGERAAPAKRRSPILAAVLSGFFPGLGQLYNRERMKGLLFFAGGVLTAFGPFNPLDVNIDMNDPATGLRNVLLASIPFMAIAAWSVIDAYRTAQRTSGQGANMADKTPRPFTPREEKIGSVVIKFMSHLNTWTYRVSGGRVTGRFPGGAPVLLLTTTGRKTGQPQTAPLLYLQDGERYVVVASKGGMSHHPLWFKNLEANPRVEIEVGSRKIAAAARRASDEEKAALWPRLVAMYSSYADYQARTTRDIPVVILTPQS
jgi:deazaflavin-dependent oxidoreductase (nitroreductase family)